MCPFAFGRGESIGVAGTEAGNLESGQPFLFETKFEGLGRAIESRRKFREDFVGAALAPDYSHLLRRHLENPGL